MTSIPNFLDYSPDPLDLGDTNRRFPRRHLFQEDDVHAVNAALAAGRPLLLRGKPGTGKSQLALAAAVGLGRAFVSEVIDARSESRDLLWRFDAVRRLADAQAFAARRPGSDGAVGDPLDEGRYTAPGPLWWAFNWRTATKQAETSKSATPLSRPGCHPQNGVVVLLDEIDKADSSVPNGLLGVLGDGEFQVPGVGPVACGDIEPLVVINTNEERSLPDAFLRRCAVHELVIDEDPLKLAEWLLRLGRAHFEGIEETILKKAATLTMADRETCLRAELHPPGGAEFLDLLRVVVARSTSTKQALEHLEIARQFFLQKHPRGDAF